jgi:serine phosphatase RsbU (regulator of sigma subunit)/CHASE2 domain-containing sensor protein
MTDSRSRSDAFGDLEPAARIRVRVGALTAALAVAVLLLVAGDALRQPLFDLYHRISPAPKPNPSVAVVVIDTPSLAALGGWPWSRYVMARLTERIAERGAQAIGFDFLFPETDRQAPSDFVRLYPELAPDAAVEVRRLPSMDDIFAQVIGRTPTVLARAGVTGGSFDALDKAAPAPFPPEARFQGPQPQAIPAYAGVTANLDVLDGAAAGHGLANGPPDRDGMVRRVPLLGRAGGVLTPSLALDLVRVAEGDPPIRLEGDPHALTAIGIGRHRVPVQAGGQVLLRFTASPPDAKGEQQAAYPTFSAVDLLRQGGAPDAFKGKIVLVGLAAAGTSDVVNTVRDGRTYGVFVQAQAVDAILRSAALIRPAWAAPVEWGVGLLLVIVSFLAVPRLPLGPVVAGALAETAAAFGASWLAFQHGWLVDPIPMLAPGAANSAVMVAMLFVEGRRLQARLRTALEDQRLAAARISGELAAASEIQSGMLLPRADLARVCPAVEIDAALKPAKTVGGDLYDAFLFDDGRVCFLVGDVTGKGVPASLFMALSKALSRSLLMRPATPLQDAVEEINRELSRDNRQAMAVSLLVGVLRPADGDLQLVSAGHENPLVVDAEGRVRELKLDGGPPLCVDETFPYPAEGHTLAPGEILVAFTDGLTEAQAPDGRLFDRESVLAAVGDAARAPTLAGMVDALIARVRAFEAGGEPSDDLTVLAVRRKAIP